MRKLGTNYPTALSLFVAALAFVAFMATFSLAARANDMDRGVATALMYNEFCGGGLPAQTLTMADMYLETRYDAVMVESRRIMDDGWFPVSDPLDVPALEDELSKWAGRRDRGQAGSS